MKWLNGYRMSLVLVGFVVVIVIGGGSAYADFTFGEPVNVGPNVNSSGWDSSPSISTDNLELYFSSGQSGGHGELDIWVTTKQTTRQSSELIWGESVNLGQVINSASEEAEPCISSDGLEIYFNSNRSGSHGGHDLYVATRKTRNDPWEPPVNLGPIVNSAYDDFRPQISSDGLSLFFSDGDWNDTVRPGGLGMADIWVTTRTSKQAEWSEPINLGAPVNSNLHDVTPSLSGDGLLLFFGRGTFVAADIWFSRRKTTNDPWEEPAKIGLQRGNNWEGIPHISPDGSTLYWTSYERSGGFGGADIWQVSVNPIVDLNADGIVDAADMCIIVDNWGTDNSLCDVGPMPWGDGIVDVQDLIVLAEHLFEDLRVVAHWKFDETGGSIAYDSIDVNDGICYGEPLWVFDGGKVGGALQFDGIDDYVETPFVLNPSNGSLSTFAWIKGGAPGQTVISQIDGTGAGSAWLCINPSDGRLITKLMHPPFSPLESESVITDGLWHYVGVVYNFDGLHRRLYVDGAEVAKDISPVAALGSDGGLYIGADKTLEAATFFSGLIDDVRIYDVALTTEEIVALAQ